MKKLISIFFILLLIQSCKKEDISNVVYPNKGYYGTNILALSDTTFVYKGEVSFSCIVTGEITVKIKITVISSEYEYPFSIIRSSSLNYVIYPYDRIYNYQIIESVEYNHKCDCSAIMYPAKYKIELFNNDILIKIINIEILEPK